MAPFRHSLYYFYCLGMLAAIWPVPMWLLDGQTKKLPNGWAHMCPSKRGMKQTSNVIWSRISLHYFELFNCLFHRLELVTGALQKYRNVVRQKNVIKYDPIYPIISNYLENVIKCLWESGQDNSCHGSHQWNPFGTRISGSDKLQCPKAMPTEWTVRDRVGSHQMFPWQEIIYTWKYVP